MGENDGVSGSVAKEKPLANLSNRSRPSSSSISFARERGVAPGTKCPGSARDLFVLVSTDRFSAGCQFHQYA